MPAMNLKKTICIVDDHQFIIDGIKRMLKSEETFIVDQEFTHPILALDFFSQKPIKVDLLICDISMPELNGIELMQRIKSINPGQKILALTMHEDIEFAKQLYLIGVEGYLFKNSSQDKFIEAINRILLGKTTFENSILQEVLKEVKSTNEKNDLTLLTEREVEILKLIVEEKSSKEIADALEISKQTVDTHRKHILKKTKVNGIIGLIKFAYANNLIS